jgi:hypothetical protein
MQVGKPAQNLASDRSNVPIGEHLLSLNHPMKICRHVGQHYEDVVKIWRRDWKEIHNAEQIFMLHSSQQPDLSKDAFAMSWSMLYVLDSNLFISLGSVFTKVDGAVCALAELPQNLQVSRKFRKPLPATTTAAAVVGHVARAASKRQAKGAYLLLSRELTRI